METVFFNSPDLGECFEKLTDLSSVIKAAYRLAGYLLRETLCRGSQLAILSVKTICAQTGLSDTTVRNHLECLAKLGIFYSHELGAGGHRERLIILGTQSGRELSGAYLAGLSIAELIEHGELLAAKKIGGQEKITLPPKNLPVPPKNLPAAEKNTLPPKNLPVAKSAETTPAPENPPKAEKSLAETSPAYTRGSDPDLDLDLLRSDQIRSDLDQISKDPIRSKPEALEVAAPESEETDLLLSIPQQLGFLANLVAKHEQEIIHMRDFLSSKSRPELLPPEQPAPVTDLSQPADRFSKVHFGPLKKATEKTAPENWSSPCPPPGWSAAEWAAFKIERTLIAQQQDPDFEAKEAKRQTERNSWSRDAANANQVAARELKRAAAQELALIPVGEQVWQHYERCIAKHPDNNPERDRPKVMEFIRDLTELSQVSPEILLPLEKAFEQAFSGKGRSISVVKINLHRLAAEQHIPCPSHWQARKYA